MEILRKLSEGEKLTPTEEQKILDITAQHNITIDEAVALYLWSTSSAAIQHPNDYMHSVMQNLETQLNQVAPQNVTHILASMQEIILQMRQNVSQSEELSLMEHSKGLQTLYESARTVTDRKSRVSVLSAILQLYIALSAPVIIQLMRNAIERNRTDKPLIVYRAMKYPIESDEIVSNGFMSTSKTLEDSFAKYASYQFVLTVYIPVNTPCLDITPLSVYGDTENEILFLPNTIEVLERKICNNRIYATGRLRMI